MSSILKAVSISKSFKKDLVLDDVSCEINKGSITFIFGPSGSGKSTLLNCLSGIENIEKGFVIFNNDKILSNSESNNFNLVYPEITAVNQDYSLWPHLTNLENITLSNCLNKNVNILSLAKKLEIFNILDKFPYQCSGGERQRVAFLRHIALKPKVLLLDEITSALDVEQIEVLSEILIELKKEGTAIFIVTHMLSFVKKIGDYFYFMDKGKVVEKGTTNEFEHPKTERLKSFLSLYRI